MKTRSFIIIACLFCCFSIQAQNSTQLQLQADKNNYDVLFYFLNLNVSDTSTYVSGSVAITVKSLVATLQQAVFDFSDLLYTDSVTVDRHKVTFTRQSNLLLVDLPVAVAQGNKTEIEVFYHGLGSKVQVPDGIYNKYVTSVRKYVTWTLTEPFSAYYWFPCKQSLTDKADSVYIFLSTSKNLKVGSNGLLTSSVPLNNDRIRYEWKCRYPIDYYLISFTVTDYIDYSFYVHLNGLTDSMLVQNYVYNDSSYFKQNKVNIDKTGPLLQLYSNLLGTYPFSKEKYGHCMAPFGGGMEHQTMTTLVNFSFLLVAHEMFHQWFGDYVTCSSWQDIWINEGFASYGEYLANQNLRSQDEADSWIQDCNSYVMSQPGGSVYVPLASINDENRIFDYRLTYQKGASIIHMIRQEVGNDSAFFDILKTFLADHKFSNASGEDFKNHLEQKTGKNFDNFFNQWYYGEGYPVHTIIWQHRNDTLYINSTQTVTSTTPLFNVLLEFKVTANNNDTIVSFRQTASHNNWQLYLPGNVTAVQPDPNHWLLIDLSDFSGISQTETDSELTIKPNPASNSVTITLDRFIGKYKMVIANVDGKIMKSFESTATENDVDVHTYSSGIYFIIIKNEKNVLHGKFIVN